MALKGLKVVEIAGLAPVPFCGMLFADFGANVIRIDQVKTGGMVVDKLGRGKQSIAIDLKHPVGKSIIRRLTSNADILLDPFRPGVMEKLELGPTELMKDNPRLIYGRISGYGQTGPYCYRAGHDINYIALSGVLSRLGKKGDNPTPPVNLLADFAGGGLMCAFGILMALFERNASGKGQVVDNSMTEGSAYVSSFLFKTQELPIWGKPRGENWLDGGSHFYNTYKTKDNRYMAVGAIEPKFYAKLMEGLGLQDDPIADDQFGDTEKYKELMADKFLEKTQEDWTRIFDGMDACVNPILEMEEAPEHPQNLFRSSFVKNPYTEYWEPQPAPRLSRTPGEANMSRPDPSIGEHTVKLLHELGFDGETISKLLDQGIVEANVSSSKL